MKVSIVCGLAFGDEGKGVVTSSLSLMSNQSLIIRYGAGQQCGHTVYSNINEIKESHVFSNFGSGTLHGHPSYFSEYCTIDPFGIKNEFEILKQKGVNPILYIDPLSMITTPFDLINNRGLEKINKHGSCGVGFGATIERNENKHYKLFAIDLLNKWIFEEKLNLIHRNLHNSIKIDINYFYESVNWLINNSNIIIEKPDFNNYDNIIFEGHQGIMLDKDFGFFPHVTRSNTTTKNALNIIKANNLKNPEIFYVTRSYLTRHGNGPMPYEFIPVFLKNNSLETNVYNKYQGEFRCAPFNLDLIKHSLRYDELHGSQNIKSNLVITCCDQIVDKWGVVNNDSISLHDDIYLNRIHFDKVFEKVYKIYSPYSNIIS